MYAENQELKKINEDLLNTIKKKAEVIWTNDSYYMIKDDKRQFCSRCFDAEDKLIATHYWGQDTTYRFLNVCPNCNLKFEI